MTTLPVTFSNPHATRMPGLGDTEAARETLAAIRREYLIAKARRERRAMLPTARRLAPTVLTVLTLSGVAACTPVSVDLTEAQAMTRAHVLPALRMLPERSEEDRHDGTRR